MSYPLWAWVFSHLKQPSSLENPGGHRVLMGNDSVAPVPVARTGAILMELQKGGSGRPHLLELVWALNLENTTLPHPGWGQCHPCQLARYLRERSGDTSPHIQEVLGPPSPDPALLHSGCWVSPWIGLNAFAPCTLSSAAYWLRRRRTQSVTCISSGVNSGAGRCRISTISLAAVWVTTEAGRITAHQQDQGHFVDFIIHWAPVNRFGYLKGIFKSNYSIFGNPFA